MVNNFSCACNAGYTGNSCDTDINECETNPCVQGTCTNLDGDYSCSCPPGTTGRDCNQDVDECQTSNPCLNGGTCANTIGSYTCACETGFTGSTCDEPVIEQPGSDTATLGIAVGVSIGILLLLLVIVAIIVLVVLRVVRYKKRHESYSPCKVEKGSFLQLPEEKVKERLV